jgi:hypothetical protein
MSIIKFYEFYLKMTYVVLPINPLKPSGDYMNHLLYQSVILHFIFMGLVWFSV